MTSNTTSCLLFVFMLLVKLYKSLLIDYQDIHFYNIKPYHSAIYSAGVAASSALASAGASSVAVGACSASCAWSALPPA